MKSKKALPEQKILDPSEFKDFMRPMRSKYEKKIERLLTRMEAMSPEEKKKIIKDAAEAGGFYLRQSDG